MPQLLGFTFSFSLHSSSVIDPVEDEPSSHWEEDPDHAEEGRLEAQDGHNQGEEGPQQLADLKVQGLNYPSAIRELEELKRMMRCKI